MYQISRPTIELHKLRQCNPAIKKTRPRNRIAILRKEQFISIQVALQVGGQRKIFSINDLGHLDILKEKKNYPLPLLHIIHKKSIPGGFSIRM